MNAQAQEAALATLNGLLRHASDRLALPLRLRRHGRALAVERAALSRAIPNASGKIVVLLHGLCCSDRIWQRHGHDHGAALERDLGYTALYLHYNSGRHISVNGQEFAALLEQLVREWPVAIEEIVLIGHSMGGLVARSACFYGRAAGHAWLGRLKHMIFLGTPHHGVPLERAVHRLALAFDSHAFTAPIAGFARLRSAGISDLGHGYLVDEDWRGVDAAAHAHGQGRRIPLPRAVKCYAIAGSAGGREGDLRGRLLGDGLIPLDTALGRHPDPEHTLRFASSRTAIAFGMHHFDLLGRVEVYERIRAWLAQAGCQRGGTVASGTSGRMRVPINRPD